MDETQLAEIQHSPLNKRNLEIIEDIPDNLFWARVIRYIGDKSIALSVEDRINPGDQMVELIGIKDVTKVGHESIQKSIQNIKQYLDSHPEISYVATLTWLKSLMEKLGFKKSDLPVAEEQKHSVLEEVLREDFRRKVDSLDPNQPDYFGKKFRPDDVGLYYVRPQDIRIPVKYWKPK